MRFSSADFSISVSRLAVWGACFSTVVGWVFWTGAVRAEEAIRLVLPALRVSVSDDSYVLCGLVPKGVDSVLVKTSTGEFSVSVVQGGFGVPLSLKPGVNDVDLSIKGGTAVHVEISRTQPDETPPEGVTPLVTHPGGVSGMTRCEDCHPKRNQRRGRWSRIRMKRKSCSTNCHQDIMEEPYLHGPTSVGSCASCHTPHGSANELALITPQEELCAQCHETQAKERREVVHMPFAEGECTGCHSPHGGKNRFFFRTEKIADTCLECHDEEEMTRSSKHYPVEEGNCSVCHQPHASENESLLNLPGNDLCLSCHEDMKDYLGAEVEHPPVKEDCLNCHSPHTTDNEPLLQSAAPGLCGNCHEEVSQVAVASKVKHPPVAEGGCGGCHDIHGSNVPALLIEEKPTLCFECHIDTKEEIEESEYKHGPVEDGECEECHNVHGSENPRLLISYLVEDFYSEYDEGSFELCFQCHNEDIARDKNTDTLTDFRNGDRNLHFLHVNRKKGRTCRACHHHHASNQERHIKEGVPFGNWEIPIFFETTSNGGSCEVGCHRPKTYDRIRPVRYPSAVENEGSPEEEGQ